MIKFKAQTGSGEIIKSALSPFTFPAGEAHTKREDRRELESTEIAVLYGSADIHSDLFQLRMWADYLHRQPQTIRKVAVIPYFPGARADRGEPFGLRVYVDEIERMGLDRVVIFDPHSQVTPELLVGIRGTELRVVYPMDLVQDYRNAGISPRHFDYYDGVIAPDKGAVLRADGVATVLDVPLYTAEKTRDFETGKLSGFKLDGLPPEGRYLIVDDICDAGGTFLGLADAIGLGRDQLSLYVSHGVFSKDALTELPKKFNTILTTTSYDPRRNLNMPYEGWAQEAWPETHEGHKPLETPFVRIDVMTDLLAKVSD